MTFGTRPDGAPLEAVVRIPRGAGPFPGLVHLHGGAWSHFGPEADFPLCERLASLGLSVFSPVVRLAPSHPFPAFLEDARHALAHVHAHADELRVDRTRIGTLGTSSGGHLAILLGLLPSSEDARAGASGHASFAIGLYPILDVPARFAMASDTRFPPLSRALAHALDVSFSGLRASPPTPDRELRGASTALLRLAELRRRRPRLGDALGTLLHASLERVGRTATLRALEYPHLVEAHLGAFRDVETMRLASPRHVVEEGRHAARPRLLVLQGTRDPNVTQEMSRTFAELYERAGGEIELAIEPGLAHGFASIPCPTVDLAAERIAAFARRG